MATSSSGKVPASNRFPSSNTNQLNSVNSLAAHRQREALRHSRRHSFRWKPIDLRLKMKAANSPNLEQAGPIQASSGVLIDEIRNGIKILMPSTTILPADPLVEKIQVRLKELGLRYSDGNEIIINGQFCTKMGGTIAALRSSLANRGYESGEFIDGKLIEYILPRGTKHNVEQRVVEICEQNANLGEFPEIIKECQRLLNAHIPDAKLLENGLWSPGLAARISEFQAKNLLEKSQKLDAATLKLLRGANLRDVVASGDATLIPGQAEKTPSVPFIKVLQQILNKYLRRELTLDGIFSEKTAAVLEIAQKAAGVRERGVFSKESYDHLVGVIKDHKKRKEFLEQVSKITLAQEFLINLGDEKISKSLMHKMNLVSNSSKTPEHGLIQMLEVIGVDIESSTSIAAFQSSRLLPNDGRISKKTAEHLSEVLSAQWYKDRVSSLNYNWRDGNLELNIIGLRGWSSESGPNDNAKDEWNDTIAFVWKDAQGRLRYKEYTTTTDPGLETDGKDIKDKEADNGMPCMEQGQYKYAYGYFNGRSGAAVPVGEDTEIKQKFAAKILHALKNRIKTFLLGSHPYAIHWMEISIGIDNIEHVGQLSLGAQVPKINKYKFKKEITPLLKSDPSRSYWYTLIDMSIKKYN